MGKYPHPIQKINGCKQQGRNYSINDAIALDCCCHSDSTSMFPGFPCVVVIENCTVNLLHINPRDETS